MQSTEIVQAGDPAYQGQAWYTASNLKFYDFFVYRVTLPIHWRCSKSQLLALYDEHVSGRHLDIGVATGALIDQCEFPVADPDITLMDINANCLARAARRLKRYAPRTHQASVVAEWGFPPEDRFESVAMMNLLHLVPGKMPEKAAAAFDSASAVLAPGGTLFGATVLGKGVRHTLQSKLLMRRLNRDGSFTNAEDSPEDLEKALADRFPTYRVDIKGAMGLFVAKTEPKGLAI
jgi:ubiquinone/menaquinone biosynthesis C-methylase UbiE